MLFCSMSSNPGRVSCWVEKEAAFSSGSSSGVEVGARRGDEVSSSLVLSSSIVGVRSSPNDGVMSAVSKGEGSGSMRLGSRSKGVISSSEGEDSESKGDGASSKGDATLSKGEGWGSKGDGSDSKGDGCESKGEGALSKGVGGASMSGSGAESKGDVCLSSDKETGGSKGELALAKAEGPDSMVGGSVTKGVEAGDGPISFGSAGVVALVVGKGLDSSEVRGFCGKGVSIGLSLIHI